MDVRPHELAFGAAALLTFPPREGTLVDQWSADHTLARPGGVPLLALETGEQAHRIDRGSAAGACVDAFVADIDRAAVHRRDQHPVHAARRSLAEEDRA